MKYYLHFMLAIPFLLVSLSTLVSCAEKSPPVESKKQGTNKNTAKPVYAYKPVAIKGIPVVDSTTMSPREFGKLVFSTIRKNNFSEHRKLLLNRSDLDYFFAMKIQYLNDNHATPEVLKQEHSRADNATRMFDRNRKLKLQQLEKSYKGLRAAVERQGMNWDKTEFVGVHQEKMRAVFKIWQTDIFVTVRAGKKHFVLKISRMMRTKRGWILTEPVAMEGITK